MQKSQGKKKKTEKREGIIFFRFFLFLIKKTKKGRSPGTDWWLRNAKNQSARRSNRDLSWGENIFFIKVVQTTGIPFPFLPSNLSHRGYQHDSTPQPDMEKSTQQNPMTMSSHQKPVGSKLYADIYSSLRFSSTGHHLPNKAKKLFRLPIFCAFFAFLSNQLGPVGMGGIAGLSIDGLGIASPGRIPVSSRSGSSFGLWDFLRVRVLKLPFFK